MFPTYFKAEETACVSWTAYDVVYNKCLPTCMCDYEVVSGGDAFDLEYTATTCQSGQPQGDGCVSDFKDNKMAYMGCMSQDECYGDQKCGYIQDMDWGV